MVFSSTVFLFLFLPLALLCYYNPFWKSRQFKNVCLLFASLVFYAWGEPLFVFIMIVSIGVNWFLGILIDKNADTKIKKRYMIIAIVYDVFLLFIFKYLTFVIRHVNLLLKSGKLSIINITLPIGISFFTFQMISYILDIYYKKTKVQVNPVNLALYISMFPQLIAGPIVRYQTVEDEINNRQETPDDMMEGIARFIIGLSKKMLIANYMGFIADAMFNLDILLLSVAAAWLGAAAYTLQIFFDFSAYSDMAIGLGKMFGFHFLENFNFPYIANSITDFWRRWHISLSTWFRDYVYIPLGGSRRGKGRLIFNLFVVWLLTGIWHGANWTFMAWGLFYLVLLLVERFTGIIKKLGVFSHVYTLFFVIIGWVLFRSESIVSAGQYLKVMFGLSSNEIIDDFFYAHLLSGKWVFLAGIVCSMPAAPALKRKLNPAVFQIVSSLGLIVLFSLSFMVCVNSKYNPFIYFYF